MSKITTVHKEYKKGGMNQVLQTVKDYFYRRFAEYSGLEYKGQYEASREDLDKRWKFIQQNIEKFDSLIDIGCAEGFNTGQSAQSGLFSIGIDYADDRLATARKKYEKIDGCSFMKYRLTPNNIQRIPSVDVILFLTVHHHWEQSYSLDDSELMFQILMSRSNRLVYEPPGDRPLVKDQSGTMDPEQSIKYYTDRLTALYGEDIEIIDATMTERFGTERRDPVFCLDTSNFNVSQVNG